MLYPNLNPNGFFALQLFVIESDDNHRRFGEKLETALGDEAVKGAVGNSLALYKVARPVP